jgi:DNA polymerase/3'-5' exonuclease PolX
MIALVIPSLAPRVITSLDFIITSKDISASDQPKQIPAHILSDHLKVKPELLQTCLPKTKILSAAWLTECLKTKSLIDQSDYLVPIAYPQR